MLGLSGGVLVGTGTAAFITLLDIVPRLSQITNTQNLIRLYERIIVVGIVSITLYHFLGSGLNMNRIALIPLGFILGTFIGLLASALAEVINVMPVLERRLKLGEYVYYALLSISLGKVVGSLVYWLVLVDYR